MRVEGRPLFAGVLSQPRPDDDLAATWWLADQLREYRGDVHTAARITAGVDATEMGLLTEALGDDLDEFVAIMNDLSATIRADFGYLAAGPHDLARR